MERRTLRLRPARTIRSGEQVHQVGVDRPQALVVQTEAPGCRRPEVVDHCVGSNQDPTQYFARRRLLKVDSETLLACTEVRELQAGATERIATEWFDLDDPGPQ